MKIALSLFDGMSCGQLALQRAGISVDYYLASEVDKYAITVTKKNFPETEHIGDVREVDGTSMVSPFILMGGSPCQSFSFAGKRKGMATEQGEEITTLERYLELKGEGFQFSGQSYLFWEYVRILRETKPKYFLLENVKMAKKWENIISETLGVHPIEINSNLLSAQNRKRLYWTNIPGIIQPRDMEIKLKDIVHEYVDAMEFEELSEYIVPFDKTLQILDKEVGRGKVGYFRKDSQANRVYYIHDKAVILCGEAGGGAAKMGQYLFGCITPDRVEKRQNGQRFNDGKKFYTLTAQDKHGILIEGYIRKLTPVECERLQTLPDNYTEGVSNTQRYKMLGNGWTVDVIAHIFSHIPTE